MPVCLKICDAGSEGRNAPNRMAPSARSLVGGWMRKGECHHGLFVVSVVCVGPPPVKAPQRSALTR